MAAAVPTTTAAAATVAAVHVFDDHITRLSDRKGKRTVEGTTNVTGQYPTRKIQKTSARTDDGGGGGAAVAANAATTPIMRIDDYFPSTIKRKESSIIKVVSVDTALVPTCGICKRLVDDPLRTPCLHYMCRRCIQSAEIQECTHCAWLFTASECIHEQPIGLADVIVHCAWYADVGCKWQGRYDDLSRHYHSECKQHKTAIIDALVPRINHKFALEWIAAKGVEEISRMDSKNPHWLPRVTHGSFAWCGFWKTIQEHPPDSKICFIDRFQFAVAIEKFLCRTREFETTCAYLDVPVEPYWYALSTAQLQMLADIGMGSSSSSTKTMDKYTFLALFQFLLKPTDAFLDGDEAPPLGLSIELVHKAFFAPSMSTFIRERFFPPRNTDRSPLLAQLPHLSWALQLAPPRPYAPGKALNCTFALVLCTRSPLCLADSTDPPSKENVLICADAKGQVVFLDSLGMPHSDLKFVQHDVEVTSLLLPLPTTIPIPTTPITRPERRYPKRRLLATPLHDILF